jgi:hypothetical protein
MWTVRTLYNWVKFGGSEWQVFHEDSVFEAALVARPGGRVALRLQYRGQLYDEQIHPTRVDAKRESAKMFRKLVAIGWSERRVSSAPASIRPRMGS